LLLGINATRNFSLVLQAGPGVVAGGGGFTGGSSGGSAGASSFALRYGLGFNIRISDFFAIHPEVGGQAFFGSGATGHWISGGIGFQLGASPDFSDLDGPPAPRPEPRAPQPGWAAPVYPPPPP